MSDISPGTIVNLSPMKKKSATAGEAFTAGASVYLDLATGRWKKAKADALATTGYGSQLGIAVTTSSGDGDIFTVTTGGDIDMGVSVTAGTVYVVSDANAGGICPWADLGSGNFVAILGVGNLSDILSMNVFASGIAHA